MLTLEELGLKVKTICCINISYVRMRSARPRRSSSRRLTPPRSTPSCPGGALAADSLAQQIGGKGTVAVIDVNPGISTTDARIQGFDQEMKAKYPGITVLSTQYEMTAPGRRQPGRQRHRRAPEPERRIRHTAQALKINTCCRRQRLWPL